MKFIYSFILIVLILTQINFAQDEIQNKPEYDVFSFYKEVTLPGTPEVIFDAVTGDISG